MSNQIIVNEWSVRLMRIMVSGIFLVAGVNHMVNTEKVVGRIEHASLKGFAYYFGEPMMLVDTHLKKAKEIGVNLVACGFSLKNFQVDRDTVPDGMSVVDNGILYNLRLQKMGYKSIEL